jgi:hypothetical protein
MKVEMYLVVVVVVRGRVDKPTQSASTLSETSVQAFQNPPPQTTTTSNSGAQSKVAALVFQHSHRRPTDHLRQPVPMCGRRARNRMKTGHPASPVFDRVFRARGNHGSNGFGAKNDLSSRPKRSGVERPPYSADGCTNTWFFSHRAQTSSLVERIDRSVRANCY